MKKHLLITFALLCCSSVFLYGQKASYLYDAAGNRTERIIVLTKSAKLAGETPSQPEPVEDILQKHKIKIYPNPTQGALSVSIQGAHDIPNGNILITNAGGNLIVQKKINSTLIRFDLSRHPSGLYLMKISIDGEFTSWKIIRE